MRGFWIYYTLTVFFTSFATSQTSDAGTPFNSRPVLLLTGDSLTAKGMEPSMTGWITQLQTTLRESTDIIARGFPGYNSRWFLKHVMPVLLQEIKIGAYSAPSLITVWLGTNDGALPSGSDGAKHISVEEYSNNLKQIILKFQKAVPDTNILLITPPPIDDSVRAEKAVRGFVDRSNAVMGTYARACAEVATTMNVSVLNLYKTFNATRLSTILIDGIHFSEYGQIAVNDQVRAKIRTDFPRLQKRLDTSHVPLADIYFGT